MRLPQLVRRSDSGEAGEAQVAARLVRWLVVATVALTFLVAVVVTLLTK